MNRPNSACVRFSRLLFLVFSYAILGSMTSYAEILHPETVFFKPLKDGFSFSASATARYFYQSYNNIGVGLNTKMLFKDGPHIAGVVGSGHYELADTVRTRNDAAADMRYYYRIMDGLYGEAFIGGNFNEQSHIDYIADVGAGIILPLELADKFTMNVGVLGFAGWYSISHAAMFSPGVIPFTSLSLQPMDNLRCALNLYLQMLIPNINYCTIPVESSVEFKVTDNLTLGARYTFSWDVLATRNQFTHDVFALISVKL
ncbi:MAG: hypothetical protein HZC28_03010 [Spirochaetes bacterium]|nr:hypothetical protein [Spirochaetota bacterium]